VIGEFGKVEIWESGNLEIWKSGNLEIPKSGNLEISRFRNFEISKDFQIPKFPLFQIDREWPREIAKRATEYGDASACLN